MQEIKTDLGRISNVTGHVFAAIRREFVRIFLTFFGGLAIGAGAVEGTSFFTNSFGLTLSHIAAGVFGVVLGYAAALTVAIVETVRALIALVRETATEAQKIEKAALSEAGKAVGGAEGLFGGVVQAVESKIEHRP